jgi:hypothetical protein
MVVLYEMNTSFGHFAQEKLKSDDKNDPNRNTRVFYVPFPLHISQLRVSYTKEQLAELQKAGIPRPTRNLPFPQGENEKGGAGEAVPVQSPLTTIATNDLILGNLVTTRALKHARHVCLIASDNRDSIFLASRIRERAPDVQLCPAGGDLLFTHADYNYALEGMILASCYPLNPAFQGWSSNRNQVNQLRIVFANQASQGYYNASLVHLVNILSNSRPLSAMLDYGWRHDDKGTRPGIWISAVGRNGQMIPLHFVSPTDIKKDLEEPYVDYLYKRGPSASPGVVSGGHILLPNLSALLIVAIVATSIWRLVIAHGRIIKSNWSKPIGLNWLQKRQCWYKQRFDFTVSCIAALIFFGLLATVMYVPAWFSTDTATKVACWAIFGLLQLTIIVVFALSFHVQWKTIRLIHAIILLTALCFFLLIVETERPVYQQIIWYERLAQTSNGLSPIVPLFFLCAAIFAWGLFMVKKLYLANRFTVPCPFPDDMPGRKDFKDLNRLDRLLRAEITPHSRWLHHPLSRGLVLAGLVLIFAKMKQESIPPLDGTVFGVLTGLGFLSCSCLVVFTLNEFYITWRLLRKILQLVALIPMGDAFCRLPDKVVAIFGNYFSSLRPRNSHLKIAVHQFDLLSLKCETFRIYLTQQQLSQAGTGMSLVQVDKSFIHEFPTDPKPLDHRFLSQLNAVDEHDYEQDGRLVNDQARKCLTILPHLWPAHSMQEAFGGSAPVGVFAAPGKWFLSLPKKNPLREWGVAAENFVAVEIVRYLSQFFVQMRNLLNALVAGALLLLIAAASYPFRPQYLILLFFTALGAGVAGLIVMFLVQVNKDELVSRITRTAPHRFTPDLGFIQMMATYVLPIVGGLFLQFSFFTSGIMYIFDPVYHIMR